MQTNVSLVALIVFGALIAVVGLALLSLLATVINAIAGRRRPDHQNSVGAWSGVAKAFALTAIICVVLCAIAVFGYLQMASVGRRVATIHTEVRGSMDRKEEIRAEYEALQRQNDLIPIDVAVAPPAPPDAAVAPLPAEADDTQKAETIAAAIVNKTPESNPVANKNMIPGSASDVEKAAFVEARRLQLEELAAHIGQFVRSRLESAGENSGASPVGQAAKSDNGDVVVFQPSDDMVQQLLGTSGQEFLKKINSELPGRIQKTYALIPLTPPVGATVPVKPLLAAGGLQSIANSIVVLVERSEDINLAENGQKEIAELPAESHDTLTVAPLTAAPEPEWIKGTDGRRIVVRTKPILEGDDLEAPLNAAINEALTRHVADITATMDTSLHDQARFVRMELLPAAAKKCTVETYSRRETMATETEGAQLFYVLYALVEFPESVDQLAVRQIRQSIQKDRIASLGIVVGCAWLSICSAGFGIRQWRKGTRLRRLATAPVFAVITIPMLVAAAGMVIVLSQGNVPHAPWNSERVSIELPEG